MKQKVKKSVSIVKISNFLSHLGRISQKEMDIRQDV
jgi:hypothetical protein